MKTNQPYPEEFKIEAGHRPRGHCLNKLPAHSSGEKA